MDIQGITGKKIEYMSIPYENTGCIITRNNRELQLSRFKKFKCTDCIIARNNRKLQPIFIRKRNKVNCIIARNNRKLQLKKL